MIPGESKPSVAAILMGMEALQTGPGTLHPEYVRMLPEWQLCRHAYEGEHAVKKNAELYVPRGEGDTDDEYKGYVMRASWFGATARTIEGLAGAVFRVAPTFEASPKIVPDLQNVTLLGDSLATLSQHVFRELLALGRCAVRVDFAPPPLSRPYWVVHMAEEVISWVTDDLGKLTRVCLFDETSEPDPDDEFGWDKVQRVHVHELVTTAAQAGGETQGHYQVRTFRYVGTNQQEDPDKRNPWKLEDTTVPVQNGQTLDYLPIVLFGARGIDPTRIYKPPVYDVASVNMSLFRTSADWEQGAHYTAMPTPWVSGIEQVEGEKTVLRMGARNAWVMPFKESRAGLLEYTGQGLEALEKLAESKKRDMAILGARLLSEEKAGVETADAMRLRSTGESSVLSALAEAFDIGMAMALDFHQRWMGIQTTEKAKPTYTTNRDFIDAKLSPEEAQIVMALWQSDMISYESAFRLLQMGEWLESGKTAEDELEEIKSHIQETTGIEIGRGSKPFIPPPPDGGPPGKPGSGGKPGTGNGPPGRGGRGGRNKPPQT